MDRISTKLLTLLVFATLVVTGASAESLDWPLRIPIDLSTGFADYLPLHFHGGIDIRTGGKVGQPVYAPTDGYLWRVKTAYRGAGQAMYLKGDDGFIYVFGHLSRYAEKINRPLLDRQVAAQEYSQDIFFPEDSIRIKKGELIAHTGQSGLGGPHLHFEKRTADNRPINPLKNGFDLSDKVRPSFLNLFVRMTDDSSLFNDGRRELARKIRKVSSKKYVVDTVFYFNRPFGVSVDCFDLMRDGGMKKSIHKLTLYYDGQPYYQAVLDTINFETTRSVALEYDYIRAVEGQKRVRRLYRRLAPNPFSGGLGPVGVYGLFDEKIGRHEGKIVAEDESGNKAELTFAFVWGPVGSILVLDSTDAGNSGADFYFQPLAEYDRFGIDSIEVLRADLHGWVPDEKSEVLGYEDGRLKVQVKTASVERALLRLRLYADGGCVIDDQIFNGITSRGKPRVQLQYELLEDGLLVRLHARLARATETRLELYYRDSLIGVEFPRCINMTDYACFIPPQEKYRRIDRIGYAMTLTDDVSLNFEDSLNIIAVGFGDEEIESSDGQFVVTLTADRFYSPQFIEVRNYRIRQKNRTALGVNSDRLVISPEAFVCRDDFEVKINLTRKNKYNQFGGIGWLDLKEDDWVWLEDNRFENNTLTASSSGGGTFVALTDYDGPEISELNLRSGHSYPGQGLRIRFKVVDALSGIPENSISVKLNGDWLPAAYDPETELVVATPLAPLKPGGHHLGVMVTDRAGNITEQYLQFETRNY